jgi:hypothetical protein
VDVLLRVGASVPDGSMLLVILPVAVAL